MDINYWNDFAHQYDDMVIDAFTYGRSNMVTGTIERFASPDLDVADFGCGPGAYIPATKELIGPSGHIYALDAQPMAIEYVQDLCRKKKYSNVTSILSDRATGLLSASIDIIFLYDILHGLTDAKPIFKELHRVVKPDGIISVNDHHLQQGEIIAKVNLLFLDRRAQVVVIIYQRADLFLAHRLNLQASASASRR